MKSYVFSVSLGTGCYRHIQISASATLFQLHKAILAAFAFEDDHAHAFFMDNRLWSPARAFYSMQMRPGDRLTKSCKLETLCLQPGDKFRYLFDFGDEWEFQCKLLRELDAPTDIPGIIRSVGGSPPQYRDLEDIRADEDWDDEDDDWDDEEDDDLRGFPEPYPFAVCQEMYEKLCVPQQTIARIKQYCFAAARVYGILPVANLFELYNSQNPPLSEVEFASVIEVLQHEVIPAYAILGPEAFYEGVSNSGPMQWEIVAEYLWAVELDDYFALTDAQKGKPLKIFPAEEFVRFADADYYPDTLQRKRMLEYLKKKEKRLKESPQLVCCGIQDMIAMNFRLQDVVDCLEPEGLTFDSQEDILEFAGLFQKLNNTTLKHANCGHTPLELEAISTPATKRPKPVLEWQTSLFDAPEPAPAKMPSKNGPCPCGSGKKYKRCCGKDQ